MILAFPVSLVLKSHKGEGQRLPPSAGSFLLMSVKRNEPKKNAFPTRQTYGFTATGDFQTRHPWLGWKRRASMHAALRVLQHFWRANIFSSEEQLQGNRIYPHGMTPRMKWNLDWLLKISNPPLHFGDPEGGAQGCAPFFDLAMDGESKNPDSNEAA